MRHFYITEEGIRLKAVQVKAGCKGCYFKDEANDRDCSDVTRNPPVCISDIGDTLDNVIWRSKHQPLRSGQLRPGL